MNLDDFRCMRQGKSLFILQEKEARKLTPIEIHNPHNKKDHALLLIHGFSSSPAVFREILGACAGYDAIVVPVLPGHGDSIHAFASSKAAEWLQHVEAIYGSLQEEYTHVDVLGLSLGGLLASHLASRFKVNHLYLLAPAFDLHLAIPSIMTLTKCLNWLGFRKLRSHAGNLYTPQFCEIAYRQLPLTTIIEILTLINEFQFILPTCPTDLFLGRYDEVVASECVAGRFANHSTTRIHWLNESAHVLPLDGDIQYIRDCVQNNLQARRKVRESNLI